LTTPTLEDGTPDHGLDNQIEPFLKHLRAAGYAERTLRKKRTIARAFARWTRRKQIALNDLNDASYRRVRGSLASKAEGSCEV
jgi:site-specific recombinase XerD